MKYIIVLLFSIGINAQEFDFRCEVDFSLITLETSYLEYYKIFADDLYFTTGTDYRSTLGRSLTQEHIFPTNTYYTYPGDTSIGFSINDHENNVLGSAAGFCNDELIFVTINLYHWRQLSVAQRLWLVYHELGHDLFNYSHNSNNGDIMQAGNVCCSRIPTLDSFLTAKERMFNNVNQRVFDCTRYIPPQEYIN